MKAINVFNEIGKLKRVLVHTPGKEVEYVSPNRLEELLFSNIMEPKNAIKEHKRFVKILEENGVEVIQLVDLVAETYANASAEEQNKFLEQWLDEVKPKITTKDLRTKIKEHILAQKTPKKIVQMMMAGFFASEIDVESKHDLIVDPIPNLFFTRDPFASIGNGVSINKMKYKTRQRETLFAQFIFECHKDYKNTERFTERTDEHTIEGGDIFVYNDETLVIGVSERTQIEAIEQIASNLRKNQNSSFEKIIAINVPKEHHLMHLDTWLTMVDYDKFIYSPNMLSELIVWEIDIKHPATKLVELKLSLKDLLKRIIGKEPILIAVGGPEAHQLDIDLETNFDATNYLAIAPGVVIGYDRNVKTEMALKANGITVLSFNGNQLSLGMGSARCMSMPLQREKIKNYKKEK